MSYTLGLDLGARSIGWAAVALNEPGEDTLLGLGVRLFEAGVEGSLELGREQSRSVQRREARNARRQTRRRRQRARLLYRILADASLLPTVDGAGNKPMAQAIQETLNRLDGCLRERYKNRPNVQLLPYLLRARALDKPLTEHELGRALYHMGQRRGFESNRKARVKADEEKGKVYDGIHALETSLNGYRTLGEYFSKIDPAEERIRSRYTHRRMYKAEFDSIWDAQQPHHAALTPELRDRVWQALFSQHPLQSKEDEVGACEWEPTERRAPVWSLEFQRFRLLQSVIHLRVWEPGGVSRPLGPDERRKLVDRLETETSLSFTEAKTVLGIHRKCKFTLEEGGETKLKGNVVGARLFSFLGERWNALDESGKSALVSAIAESPTDEEVQQRLQRDWGLSAELSRRIAENVTLPQGYASLSLKALRRVLPLLEQGMAVQEARVAAGYDLDRPVPIFDLLPPLRESGLDIRNPAVNRALTELRKVVNAAVRKWGKPFEIHIETARELKKSAEERQKDSKRMRQRETLREAMRRRIAEATGQPTETVRRSDIEIGLLWDECDGRCPYSGESLGSFSSLF
jgi:CRISPR-associated endonuclease Csn1